MGAPGLTRPQSGAGQGPVVPTLRCRRHGPAHAALPGAEKPQFTTRSPHRSIVPGSAGQERPLPPPSAPAPPPPPLTRALRTDGTARDAHVRRYGGRAGTQRGGRRSERREGSAVRAAPSVQQTELVPDLPEWKKGWLIEPALLRGSQPGEPVLPQCWQYSGWGYCLLSLTSCNTGSPVPTRSKIVILLNRGKAEGKSN